MTTEDPSKSWFDEARTDLEVSKILYDAKKYSRALYSLQQGNEKLTKALLLKAGILSPKRLKEDWATKSLLGFMPKDPSSYGHRVTSALLSDMSNAIPSLQEWLRFLDNFDEESKKISDFRKIVKKSKDGVHRLKGKPFPLLDSLEKLDREVEVTGKLLDSMDVAIDAVEKELKKVDMAKISEQIIKSFRKERLKIQDSELNALIVEKSKLFDPTELLQGVKLSMIVALAVSLSAILDPLEAVTRYPDSSHGPFGEEDPYVVRFVELYGIVERIFKKAQD